LDVGVNGVVRSLTHTHQELTARGHTVSMLTPEKFKTFSCPTYPEIRLSFFPGNNVAKIIRHHKPDVIHIATEGPLGMAARDFCIRNNLRFPSAYHTRFPEYIYSRISLPLSLSYAFIRWIHKPSEAVMTPTLQVISELKERQIANTALWPRGVDLTLFTPPKRRKRNAKPVLFYVGRVAVEKNIEDFLNIKIDAEK
jgi:glycosyltransferase involved in cell wall biosynthesis